LAEKRLLSRGQKHRPDIALERLFKAFGLVGEGEGRKGGYRFRQYLVTNFCDSPTSPPAICHRTAVPSERCRGGLQSTQSRHHERS